MPYERSNKARRPDAEWRSCSRPNPGGGFGIGSTHPSPEQAIEKVTRSVPTGALEKSGIQKIRVLNASKLEDLIHQMVESRVDAFLTRQRETGVDGAVVLDPADPEFDAKWQLYRNSQEEKLRHVEERLARLQGTFQGIETSIQKLFEDSVLPAESATGD